MDEQNPYAPPAHEDRPAAQEPPRKAKKAKAKPKKILAWREGNHAVMNKDEARLPKRCVVCNGPIQGERVIRAFSWHPAWVYWTTLIAPVVYAVVAASTRKYAKVELGLCAGHHASRRTGLLIAWGGAVFSVLFIVICAKTASPTGAIIGLVALVALPILGGSMARVASPAEITDTLVRLKVGAPFLASLPERDADDD